MQFRLCNETQVNDNEVDPLASLDLSDVSHRYQQVNEPHRRGQTAIERRQLGEESEGQREYALRPGGPLPIVQSEP